jgi:hypothetical protein
VDVTAREAGLSILNRIVVFLIIAAMASAVIEPQAVD